MATNKLTDTQRVILAAAAARDSGLVLPLPSSLGSNRGTLGIVLKSLLTRKLVTERPIMPDEDLWRDTAELGRTTLVISVEGLMLMGIDPIDHVVHKDADGNIVTDDGGISPGRRRPDVHLDTGIETPDPNPSKTGMPKEGSKLATLIASLRQAEGATISELMEATGWQAHSVRGTISGNLKKKLKLEVVSEVLDGRGRVYRIPAEEASA